MAVIINRATERSGIPLGGIGTGSVELWPDGEFHEWQIQNNGEWKEDCRENPPDADRLLPGGGLTFFLRTREETDVRVRKLGLTLYERELRSRMFSWMKPVQEITFDGRFPTAKLSYGDDSLPIRAELTAMSPFVPHEEETSGTPGFYLTFRLQNPSDHPVEVSLLGKLKNRVCLESPCKMRRNTVLQDGGATRIFLTSENPDRFCPDNGSMCFSVQGGEVSWISGEYGGYIDSYISGSREFGVSEESVLFPFRKRGRLPNASPETAPSNEIWTPDSELRALDDEALETMVERFLRYAFAQSLAERIREVDSGCLATREGKLAFLKVLRESAEELSGKQHGDGGWGDCALCAGLTLAAGEEREVRFLLSWHFPNHYSKNGQRLGHWYENRFADALEVNRFLSDNRERIAGSVQSFLACMGDTSLDAAADSWLTHLTTLVKSSWWLRDGRFGIWEGIGSCGFHTTDITYQASFGLLALFPNLQKRQMRMGAAFQNQEGRVHHFFTPDLASVDNGFGRVDMNPQFVLLVCRDYLWTGDKAYLEELFPHVEAAVESLARLDTDGDGLLDTETMHNTYDAWRFFGAPAYIESLWLSGLRAAELLASACGKSEPAKRWRGLLEKGRASMEEKLWNGSYYSLWSDGGRRDECCMTDQLSGEWYARLIGLGGILPDERVNTAVDSILAHNFSGENGLINASYPTGTKPTIYTYRNCQAEANWSGVEYCFASLAYLLGRREDAGRLTDAVDDRYKRVGMVYDHAECGDHYSRPMSSWTTLLAGSGFAVDAPGETLTFRPARGGRLRSPWVSCSAFGTFQTAEDALEIRCAGGEQTLRRIGCGLTKCTEICLNGSPLAFTREEPGLVRLSETLRLQPGDCLTLSNQR